MAENNGKAEIGTSKTEAASDLSTSFDCPICHELLHEPVVGSCGHSFCKSCYSKWIDENAMAPCPSCRRPLPKNLGVCIRLRDAISTVLPEESFKRQQEIDNEAEIEARRLKKRKDHQTDADIAGRRPSSFRHIPLRSTVIGMVPVPGTQISSDAASSSRTRSSPILPRWEPPQRLRWVSLSTVMTTNEQSYGLAVRTGNRTEPIVRSFNGHGQDFLGYVTTAAAMWRDTQMTDTTSQSVLPSRAEIIPYWRSPVQHVARPYFTIGQRFTRPLRSRFSLRRRPRQVPTRFSPEFAVPPTTLPSSSTDMMQP